jgi:hypothetical protein
MSDHYNYRSLHIVMVNGFTLPYVLLLGLMGKEVYALGAHFPVRVTGVVLSKIYHWGQRKGLITEVFDGIEELRRYREIVAYQDRVPIFRKCEKNWNQRFRYVEADRILSPSYAMAYKVTTSNYFRRTAFLPFVLHHINQLASPSSIRVIGVQRDVLAIYRAYYGEDPRYQPTEMWELRSLINFIQWTMLGFGTLVWTLSRFRLRRPEPFAADIGADYGTWTEDIGRVLMQEITEPDQKIAYFAREPQHLKGATHVGNGSPLYWAGTGHLGPQDTVVALWDCLRDLISLGTFSLNVSVDHFHSLLRLPYRRMSFRVMAKNHKFPFFLATDDYSIEHPLRTHELHKIGCRSLGIQRSITIDNTIEPSNRYIEFDYYYVFGMGCYDSFYHETWSQRMKVRAIGAWGMDRAQLARIPGNHSRDMIYVGRGGEREIQTIQAFFKIAAYFPERRFYVKQKTGGKKRYSQDIFDLLETAPKNVIHLDPDINTYELLLHAGYAIGSGSTTIAEAIRYGLVAFYHDIYPEADFYYRRFPGLTVRSADEMIERIEAYEAGKEVYPRENFNGLIELSVDNPFNVIRADLGLPPRGLPKPEQKPNPFLKQEERLDA